MTFENYDTGNFYDEMFLPDGSPRQEARQLVERIEGLPDGELVRRHQAAERSLLPPTFTVYGDKAGTERIFPFDGIVPRIVSRGPGRARPDPEPTAQMPYRWTTECIGLDPPRGVWCHITGTDLVRDADGTIYVLEDNLRCPSGVSYVLENRAVMTATFPLFEGLGVRPVIDYPSRLLSMLEDVAPRDVDRPRVAVLTPGVYNSAYFEHSFLQQMGVEVEGRDLVVADDRLQMRTRLRAGRRPLPADRRRLPRPDLLPLRFPAGRPRRDGSLSAGTGHPVNAPGTGVADDKVVYTYVPRMIEYYLDQEPILPNVPTHLCWRDEDRRYVLDHLPELFVKPANASGGYGMLVGPTASRAELDDFRGRIVRRRATIAQPKLDLSRVPTRVDHRFEGRHVDLRPYILYGRDIYVLPGGLTRVALRKGSLVVNSSQGGGSKDTWVLS